MVVNVHRNHKAYYGQGEGGNGVWRCGEREIIYLSLRCHHQSDFYILMLLFFVFDFGLMNACIALFSALLSRLTALACDST